ncbi:MAG: hypothetical protein H0X51_04420 [Parachlamydiaceae bacterium]|nr:hypothetical protein [Parachlamydiaceae bacterium]
MALFTWIFAATVMISPTNASEADQVKSENTEKQDEVKIIQFTPPAGWRFADTKSQKHVHTMVVGKGQRELPPSITLGTDRSPGTLKEYLKRIKGISESKGGDWKDLGNILTDAGEARLVQEDMKTQWGELRIMYVILLKNGTAYILTAAALKEEFAKFYPEFFRSMRSLRITDEGAAQAELTGN